MPRGRRCDRSGQEDERKLFNHFLYGRNQAVWRQLRTEHENDPAAKQAATIVRAWAPIVGRWRLEDGNAVYHGPQDGSAHPYGICVTSFRLGDGTVAVKITLSEKTSGRLLFGYRSPLERYLSVGLAGYRHAYTANDFEPSYGWRGVAFAGTEENLVPGKEYKLLSRIAEQRVDLEVDGIRVLDHVLERPLPAGQVGLFAWGEKEVVFSGMTIEAVPARVFVVMQFSDPYQQLCASSAAGHGARRGDMHLNASITQSTARRL